MEKARVDNMPEIAGKVANKIGVNVGDFTLATELTDNTEVQITEIESILKSVLSYHLARAHKILMTSGKEKARIYAENHLVPEIAHDTSDQEGLKIREVPLIEVMEGRAKERVEEVQDYFKDKKYVIAEANERISISESVKAVLRPGEIVSEEVDEEEKQQRASEHRGEMRKEPLKPDELVSEEVNKDEEGSKATA